MRKMDQVFDIVYPFATENVKDSLGNFDFKNQSVLTVGSSLDQAFHSLFCGAEEVVVYDINTHVKEYYECKKKMLLEAKNRQEFYEKIKGFTQYTSIPIYQKLDGKYRTFSSNIYLESEEAFEKMKEILQKHSLEFQTGSIYKMNMEKTFDRIIFSNILTYLWLVTSKENKKEFFKRNFDKWEKMLNKDGILELCYLYHFERQDLLIDEHKTFIYNLRTIYKTLGVSNLDIFFIPGFFDETDGVLTYTKK